MIFTNLLKWFSSPPTKVEQHKLVSPYKYFYKEGAVCCVDDYGTKGRGIGYHHNHNDIVCEYSLYHGRILFSYQGYKTKEEVEKIYKGEL